MIGNRQTVDFKMKRWAPLDKTWWVRLQRWSATLHRRADRRTQASPGITFRAISSNRCGISPRMQLTTLGPSREIKQQTNFSPHGAVNSEVCLFSVRGSNWCANNSAFMKWELSAMISLSPFLSFSWQKQCSHKGQRFYSMRAISLQCAASDTIARRWLWFPAACSPRCSGTKPIMHRLGLTHTPMRETGKDTFQWPRRLSCGSDLALVFARCFQTAFVRWPRWPAIQLAAWKQSTATIWT